MGWGHKAGAVSCQQRINSCKFFIRLLHYSNQGQGIAREKKKKPVT